MVKTRPLIIGQTGESWTDLPMVDCEDEAATLSAPQAFFIAAVEIAKTRKPIMLKKGALQCDPARHPDTAVAADRKLTTSAD